jgi:hypothetical protein
LSIAITPQISGGNWGAGPGFHRRKHYHKTGCPTLRGFRSVGIPAVVAGRFSRLYPSAAAFFTGQMGSLELFHRFISPNVHITVTEIFFPSILRA